MRVVLSESRGEVADTRGRKVIGCEAIEKGVHRCWLGRFVGGLEENGRSRPAGMPVELRENDHAHRQGSDRSPRWKWRAVLAGAVTLQVFHIGR